jgi:ribonuclease D
LHPVEHLLKLELLSLHAGLLQRTSEFSLAKNKRITMSNWAKIPLSEQQLQYAACDAYAGASADTMKARRL